MTDGGKDRTHTHDDCPAAASRMDQQPTHEDTMNLRYEILRAVSKNPGAPAAEICDVIDYDRQMTTWSVRAGLPPASKPVAAAPPAPTRRTATSGSSSTAPSAPG